MLYLILIIPVLLYLLPIKNRNIKLMLLVLPVFFVIIFRFGLGTDYFSYEFIYNTQSSLSLSEAIKPQRYDMEIGFKLLIYLFKTLRLPYQAFVATIGIVIYSFLFKWLLEGNKGDDIYTAVLLLNGMFFIVWTLSALRQGLVLAVGTYFIFNPVKEYNKIFKIILILLLSAIHTSALIYLLFILLEDIDFSRRTLIIIACSSLVFSILYSTGLFSQIMNIDFVSYSFSKIGYLPESDFKLIDFASSVRFFVLVFGVLSYEVLSENSYLKKVTSFLIIGMSIYFMTKISEILAGRLAVYTFILIIPVLTSIYRRYVYEYLGKKSIVFILIFTLVYIQKDLLGVRSQLMMKDESILFEMKVFTKENDYNIYGDEYSFLSNAYYINNKQMNIIENKESSPRDGMSYAYSFKEKKYGVINETGEWVVKPKLSVIPEIFKGLIVIPNYPNNHIPLDYDLNDIPWEASKIESGRIEDQRILDEEPQINKLPVLKLEEYDKGYFYNRDGIKSLDLITYYLPFEYNVLRVNYLDEDYYMLLDKEMKLMNGMLYLSIPRFTRNNMSMTSTVNEVVIINSIGEIVWIEEK